MFLFSEKESEDGEEDEEPEDGEEDEESEDGEEDEESEDSEEDEESEDDSGAFISSRLVSFESSIPFGLILGLGVIPEEEDAGGDSGSGVELLGIGIGGAGVCMRSFTELATTLAFVAPITVSTAANHRLPIERKAEA